MMQTILASLIVLVAFIFVLLPLFSKKKTSSSCDTCASGGCGGCPLSEVAGNKSTAGKEQKTAK